jgi:phenylacetate-CoA ligase
MRGRVRGRWTRFLLRKSPRQIDAAVRALILDAYERVPMFRERLDSVGISPHGIRTSADLSGIPPTTREAFDTAPRAMSMRRGSDPRSCHASETSGTTGFPVTIFTGRIEMMYRRLLWLRALSVHARLRLPISIAEVGTGLVHANLHRGDLSQRLRIARITKISRSLPGEEQIEMLVRARPQVVVGPPTCLEIVGDGLLRRGAPPIRPQLVATRGEVLQERVRAKLERAFECRVADYYNCEEVGNIAWECPEDPAKLHVNTDACVVHVVDEAGRELPPDAEGDVVVTNLFNRTMPLIRYNLGDRARLLAPPGGSCRCGYRGSSMSRVAGRADDFLWLPRGERVSPRTVDSLIGLAAQSEADKTVYYTRGFLTVQDADYRVHVRIVPRSGAPEDLADQVLAALQELSPDLDVTVQVVTDLPPDPSGKSRTVRSAVACPSADHGSA